MTYRKHASLVVLAAAAEKPWHLCNTCSADVKPGAGAPDYYSVCPGCTPVVGLFLICNSWR
jgi:hypothetical protein